MAAPDGLAAIWGFGGVAVPGAAGAVGTPLAGVSEDSSLGFLREVDDMVAVEVDFSRGRRVRGLDSFSFLEFLPLVVLSVASFFPPFVSSSFLRPDRRPADDRWGRESLASSF